MHQNSNRALAEETRSGCFPRYKRIWNLYADESYNYILWKVFRNAIHTLRNLSYKGLSIPTTSVFYSSAVEDVHHLFFKCSYTHFLWSKIKQKDDFQIRDSKIEWRRTYKDTKWKEHSTFELLIMLKVTSWWSGMKEMEWFSIEKKEHNAIIFWNMQENLQHAKFICIPLWESCNSEVILSVFYCSSKCPYRFISCFFL